MCCGEVRGDRFIFLYWEMGCVGGSQSRRMDEANAEELTFEPHLLGLQLALLHGNLYGEMEAVSWPAMSPWQEAFSCHGLDTLHISCKSPTNPPENTAVMRNIYREP